MSYAKRQAANNRGAYTIGDDNPLIGRRVRVRWLRTWGGKKRGHAVTGELKSTFCVNGRTLIGEVFGRSDDDPISIGPRKHSCPWSRNYLNVEPF